MRIVIKEVGLFNKGLNVRDVSRYFKKGRTYFTSDTFGRLILIINCPVNLVGELDCSIITLGGELKSERLTVRNPKLDERYRVYDLIEVLEDV